MAGFLEMVDRAQALLESRGRISLRAFRREFSLDDETLDDLAEELIERQIAARDGNALVLRGAPAPAPPESAGASAGERRQLTVMFCDLVGSTELAQRVDPEELRNILHEHRAICVEATKRFDGNVAQYLGDGVLVYFGYPRAHEDDAERAVRAGLEIQRVLAEPPHTHRIEARVGIHTGLVVVDPGGSGEDTLALGTTTNIAARIQDAAKPGSVVVSQDTLGLCRGAFVTQSLGETALKGLASPLLLHEVERSAGVRSAIGTSSERPMLGRDQEVGLLLDRWEEVQDGHGQVVLVSGDPGMGKSRLLQALRDEIRDAPHLWLDMQCSPFTSGSAFQPLVDLFHTGLSFGAADSPEQASHLLVNGLESLPGLPVEKVIPYLLPLLSLPASERYALPQTSADEQRERTLAALFQLNLTLSEQQAVVLVAEDLHWSDPSTLEYLGRLVEQIQTARVLLVLTFRPEFRAPWAQSHVSELKLARLSRRVTRELIANAVGGRLPEPVLAELETRSDGVPLFVEELASAIVSSGVMSEHAGRYELTGSLRELAIPATLQDSLMARLDRLSASKLVAQQAATLGRDFSYELIEAVSDLDRPSLRTALGQLSAAEIVHQRGIPPDAVYTFKHALLQDTAYESQLLSTRKALHAKIAAVLEERFPDRVEAEPELVARHCAAAGAYEPAVRHYQRAAELAVSRLSNQEASEHFSTALEALSSLPEDATRNQREIDIRLAHGQSLMALHGYEAREVLDSFARVEELCSVIGEGPQQLAALIGLVAFDLARGSALKAGLRAEALLRIAEPLGIPELLVLGHTAAGVVTLLVASSVEAEERLSRAVEIADGVDFPAPATPQVPDLLVLLHQSHAVALVNCGRPDQAMLSGRAIRRRLDEIDHDCSRACVTLSVAWFQGRDPEAALSVAEDALAASEGRGFHTNQALATIIRGWARASQGKPEEGVADVEAGIALAESSGSEILSGPVYAAAADAHRMAKNWTRAGELLDRGAEVCERDGTAGAATQVTLSRAHLVLDAGERREAEQLFLRAVSSAERHDQLWMGLLASTQLALLAVESGKVREAYDRLARDYDRLSEGFERAPVREARRILDELAEQLRTI